MEVVKMKKQKVREFNKEVDTAIYARTAIANAGSIAYQIDTLKNWCDKNQFKYSKNTVIQDCGSGVTLKRPGLKKLFRLIKTGKIKRVMIFDLDRLSRGCQQSLKIFKFLTKYNIELYIYVLKEKMNFESREDKLLAVISGTIAETRCHMKNHAIK